MADYVKKRTHIINHPRFLEAGAVARDLYDWGMLWSGQLETDGEIPMAALVASPWGAGQKKNVAVADKLVLVGLWERTDNGYRICKWSEQGNVTKADLEAQRAAARERMRARRSPKHEPPSAEHVRANIARTSPEVPTSTSPFTSVSGSPGGAGGAPPDWWAGSIAATEQAIGGTVDNAEARWLEYDAARERKGWARNHRDAVGWLSTVVRTERRNARTPPPKSGSELTKQPFDPEAPWMKIGDTGP